MALARKLASEGTSPEGGLLWPSTEPQAECWVGAGKDIPSPVGTAEPQIPPLGLTNGKEFREGSADG